MRLRISGCGVCGSDLPVFEGRDWFEYPRSPGAPGHEAWGHVDSLGPGVENLQVGDAAAFLSYSSYSEYDVADTSTVVVLPPELRDRPFPGEPLACAYNVFERSHIKNGDTVAVVGVGFLGAVLTQLAAAAGAKVIGLSRRSFALDVAEKMGASLTCSTEDREAALALVAEATGGSLCEVVIEATGKQQPLDLAGQMTGERGRLVIAGFHQDGPRNVDMQMWNWRGLDVINAHERDPSRYVSGLRQAVAAVADGRIDPYPLYTHAFSLTDLDQAFTAGLERPDGFIKALVSP